QDQQDQYQNQNAGQETSKEWNDDLDRRSTYTSSLDDDTNGSLHRRQSSASSGQRGGMGIVGIGPGTGGVGAGLTGVSSSSSSPSSSTMQGNVVYNALPGIPENNQINAVTTLIDPTRHHDLSTVIEHPREGSIDNSFSESPLLTEKKSSQAQEQGTDVVVVSSDHSFLLFFLKKKTTLFSYFNLQERVYEGRGWNHRRQMKSPKIQNAEIQFFYKKKINKICSIHFIYKMGRVGSRKEKTTDTTQKQEPRGNEKQGKKEEDVRKVGTPKEHLGKDNEDNRKDGSNEKRENNEDKERSRDGQEEKTDEFVEVYGDLDWKTSYTGIVLIGCMWWVAFHCLYSLAAVQHSLMNHFVDFSMMDVMFC
ncbi:hypothetical protein RFI_23697, partial [Reticulomyxa filosa]